MIRALLLSSFCAVALIPASPAMADAANLLGVFTNWSAYSTGSGGGMTCYAMSKPRASTPKGTKRAEIYLMLSDWPGRKVKSEPEIVPGYEYKLTAPISLGIGSDKFDFFARNEAKSGAAWLRNLGDGGKLLEALNSGVSAVAIGSSARGTKTVDTYSLAGLHEAIAKIHSVCNM